MIGSGNNSFTLRRIFHGIYHLHELDCLSMFVYTCMY